MIWGGIHEAEKHGFAQHLNIICLNEKEQGEYVKRWVDFLKSKCSLENLKMIAEWKGKDGKRVLEHASPSIKNAIREGAAFLGRYEIVKGPVLHRSDTAIVVQARDLRSEKFYNDRYNDFLREDLQIKDELAGDDQGLSKTGFKNLTHQLVGGEMDEEVLNQEFLRYCQSGDEYIHHNEFARFCRVFFDGGQNRSVALKFMSNKEQFDKEQESRDKLKKNRKFRFYRSGCRGC